jgi:hypothetical protein
MLVFMQAVWKIFKQFIILQQQVVKIHRPVFKTSFYISRIYLRDSRPVRTLVFLLQVIISGIFFRSNECVFGGGNAVVNGRRFIEFIVQVQFIDNRFDYIFCVIGIIDCKVGWITKTLCFTAEYPGEYRVERSDI